MRGAVIMVLSRRCRCFHLQPSRKTNYTIKFTPGGNKNLEYSDAQTRLCDAQLQ